MDRRYLTSCGSVQEAMRDGWQNRDRRILTGEEITERNPGFDGAAAPLRRDFVDV